MNQVKLKKRNKLEKQKKDLILFEATRRFFPGKHGDDLRHVQLRVRELLDHPERVPTVPGRDLPGEGLKPEFILLPLHDPPIRGAVLDGVAPVAQESVVEDIERVAGNKHLIGLREDTVWSPINTSVQTDAKRCLVLVSCPKTSIN